MSGPLYTLAYLKQLTKEQIIISTQQGIYDKINYNPIRCFYYSSKKVIPPLMHIKSISDSNLIRQLSPQSSEHTTKDILEIYKLIFSKDIDSAMLGYSLLSKCPPQKLEEVLNIGISTIVLKSSNHLTKIHKHFNWIERFL